MLERGKEYKKRDWEMIALTTGVWVAWLLALAFGAWAFASGAIAVY